jgi:hypothetical protein
MEEDAIVVLSRMDSKGETIEQAIEAVTGDRPDTSYGRKIVRYLQGIK